MSSMPEEVIATEIEHAARPRLRFSRLTIIFAAVTSVSMLLALAEEFFRNNGNFPQDSVTWIVLLHVAAFLAAELAILISLVGQLEWVVFEKALEINGLIQQANEQRYVMSRLARIFSYADERAHHAVQQAVIDLLSGIKEDGTWVSVKGVALCRLVYSHFWKSLVSAQSAHHNSKRAKALSVYAIHAASPELWDSDDYTTLRDAQKEFHTLGGTIYRIFLHSFENHSHQREFARVISDMRKNGVINAFYLDVRADADDTIAQHSDDCLLANFDEATYVAAARIKWFKGKGDIVSSRIELGSVAFEQRRKQWVKLVERLGPDTQPPLVFEEGLEVLAFRPPPEMYKRMRDLA